MKQSSLPLSTSHFRPPCLFLLKEGEITSALSKAAYSFDCEGLEAKKKTWLFSLPAVQFVAMLLHDEAQLRQTVPWPAKGGRAQLCCKKYLLRVSLWGQRKIINFTFGPFLFLSLWAGVCCAEYYEGIADTSLAVAADTTLRHRDAFPRRWLIEKPLFQTIADLGSLNREQATQESSLPLGGNKVWSQTPSRLCHAAPAWTHAVELLSAFGALWASLCDLFDHGTESWLFVLLFYVCCVCVCESTVWIGKLGTNNVFSRWRQKELNEIRA